MKEIFKSLSSSMENITQPTSSTLLVRHLECDLRFMEEETSLIFPISSSCKEDKPYKSPYPNLISWHLPPIPLFNPLLFVRTLSLYPPYGFLREETHALQLKSLKMVQQKGSRRSNTFVGTLSNCLSTNHYSYV